MRQTLTIGLLAMLAGCGPDPTIQMQKAAPEVEAVTTNSRFTVERVAVFVDDIAYNDRRGIYVITDAKTGREFIGVSGIGISETGQHNCGKSCIAQDER